MAWRNWRELKLENVKWGRVAAGASIGVLAVAAAPFTGGGSVFGAVTLLQSLTLATALGGGTLGGAIGGCMQDAPHPAEAELAATQAAFEEALQEMRAWRERFTEHQQFELFGVLMYQLGVAATARAGVLSDYSGVLLNLVFGLSAEAVPSGLRAHLEQILATPPSVLQALSALEILPDGAYDSVSRLADFLESCQVVLRTDWDVWRDGRASA